MSDDNKHIYKIIFVNSTKVYEIYAKSVSQNDFFGFIEVDEILFDAKSQVVVDPLEEELKKEFTGVETTFIPMHSVIRIDLVEKQGVPKCKDIPQGASNIAQFPKNIYTPPKG